MAVFWLGTGSLAPLMTLFSLQNGANWSQELPSRALPAGPGTGTWAEEGTGSWA